MNEARADTCAESKHRTEQVCGGSGPSRGPQPLSRIAIAGYGRFGRALAQLTRDSGLSLAAYDPAGNVPAALAASSMAELVAGASEIVLAVPIPEISGALQSLAPHVGSGQVVFDVCSVKDVAVRAMEQVLGGRVPWVSTHPLFGPSSIALGERPLRAVVCPNRLHPQAAGRARAFFERIGCTVMEQEAAEHDRSMARSHALAFFVAKGLIDMGVDENLPFAPPSFQAMSRTVEMVRSDAAHLFVAIERDNPYAAEARQELLDALLRVHSQLETLEGLDVAERSGRCDGLDIPDLGAQAPELREARDLIDELDRDLIALLARRAQLARRAGSIKANHGRSIRDPSRERALLKERKQWARQYDLDPNAIVDIFAAILRFSRKVQSESSVPAGGNDQGQSGPRPEAPPGGPAQR